MTEREKTALKALHERAERSGKRAKIYENYAAKELARALFPLYSADSDEEAFSEAFREAVSSCGVRNPFLEHPFFTGRNFILPIRKKRKFFW